MHTPNRRQVTEQSSIDANHIFNEISQLDQRIRQLESYLDDKANRAHVQAKQRDARELIDRGELVDLVVISTLEGQDESKVLSKLHGVYTFVYPAEYSLEAGDTVRARICDIGENHAEAVTLEPVEPTPDSGVSIGE